MAAYPNFATPHPFQQQQPLPPGWEARYDSNYKRYYFINHTTHETTWIDPRVTAQQRPSPQPQRLQQHAQPSQQTQRAHQPQQPTQPSPQPARQQQQESIAMQSTGHHRAQGVEEQTTSFTEEGTVSGKTDSEKQAVLRKLRKDYDVPDSLLEAGLEAVDYNERLGRELLKSMGYKTFEEERNSSSARAGESSRRTEAATEAPSSPQEYVEMPATNFSAMYQTTAATAEENAAEETIADEPEEVGNQELEELNETSADELSRPTTATSRAVSGRDVQVSVDSTLDGLLTEDAEQSLHLDTNVSAITSSSRSGALENLLTARSKQPAISANTIVSTSLATAFGTKYRTGNVVSALGHNRQLVIGPDRRLQKAKTTALAGPDPRLVHGPNKGLLSHAKVQRISSRVPAQGSNPSLCRGPDSSLVHGPITKVTVV